MKHFEKNPRVLYWSGTVTWCCSL